MATKRSGYPTAFIADRAFDLLEERFPARTKDAKLVMARVRVHESEGREERGVELLQELLARDVTGRTRHDATFMLLRLLVDTGADLAEVEAAYQAFGELQPGDGEKRRALYLVALASYLAGDYSKASAGLQEYESTHGSSPMVTKLLTLSRRKEEGAQ